MKKQYQYIFLLWFAIIPLGGVLLDLFFSTISPDPEYGFSTVHFDLSFINQAIYLSVWNALFTSLWAITKLVHLKNNKIPHWLSGKNCATFVFSLNIVVFLLYTITMIATPGGIVGFNTWYKILKSVCEHFVTPPLLILFYFLTVHEYVAPKDYARRDGFYTLIFLGAYGVVVLVRSVMIHTYDPTFQSGSTDDKWFTPFPYDQVDPYSKPLYLCIMAYIALMFAPYGVGNLFNWLSNITTSSIQTRMNNKSNWLWDIREDNHNEKVT